MTQERESEATSWMPGPEIAAACLKFNKQLNSESDRGAVIVGAALIDESLEQLLKAKLAPHNGREDALFDIPYAPLSTLSAKIDFAYRVGVIREPVKSSCHLLRKVRNDFAHSSENLTFNSSKVESRIRELFKLSKDLIDALSKLINDESASIDSDQIRTTFVEASKKRSSIEKLIELFGWRGLFDMITAIICAVLSQLPNKVEQIVALDARD